MTTFEVAVPFGVVIIGLHGPNSGYAHSKGEWLVNRIPHTAEVGWHRTNGKVYANGGRYGIRRTDKDHGYGEATWNAQRKIYEAVEQAVTKLYDDPLMVERLGRLIALQADIAEQRREIERIDDEIARLQRQRTEHSVVMTACEAATAKLDDEGIEAWLDEIERQRQRGRAEMTARIAEAAHDRSALMDLDREVQNKITALIKNLPSETAREIEQAYLDAQAEALREERLRQSKAGVYW